MPITTDTFSGTVNVGSQDIHTFTASQNGEVDVTLTSAAPPSTIVMGLGIGVPNGSSCTLVAGGSIQTAAGTTSQLYGIVSSGTYCVDVYDVGNAASPVTYSVNVAHP